MSYTIKKSDGTTLATVPENDIVLDAASVALIGRGATNYGAAHSEAFVHILENFASATAPAHPLDGQLWFDKNVSAMKVYNAGNWNLLGSGGGSGGGGGGSGTNVGGPIYVIIEDQNTGVLVFVAGGKIVCVISSKNIPNTSIPVSITVLNVEIPFRARFPFGLEAGTTLANDADDYIYFGHVPNADAALFTGGGNPFAATTFVDLGPNSVTLSVSNGVLIGAFSQAVVAQSALPTNFTVNGITMPFRAAFSNGLRKGLTLADGMSLGIGPAIISGDGTSGGGGSLTTEIVAEMIGVETEARATAISELYAYANDQFAEAGIVNTMTAEFLSGTGQSSIAQAINWLVATAGAGTANSQWIVDLKSEVTDAVTGATSFAHALSILNTAATTDYASSSDLTTLQSQITNGYTTAISNAVQNLVTQSSLTGALSQFRTDLNSEFEADTGYASFADAVNDIKTSSGSGGSTAAFDTDLRTRFTNAMQNGEAAGTIQTISQAMDKFKQFSGRITGAQGTADEIANALKTLTGVTSSTSNAVQKLVSESKLDSALATFRTTLTSEYVDAMNEVTGGTGTTFAGAVTDVIATATSDGSGSSSSIDTALRNLFIAQTHETAYPVTTIGQAIQKLMNNTAADRANAAFITELQSVFNTGLGTTTMAGAKTALTTVATKANSASNKIDTLESTLITETGQSSMANAVDWLSTNASQAGAAASLAQNIETQFKNVTGTASISAAATKLWSEASKAGAIAGYTVALNNNGYITGLEAVNAGVDQSTFKIAADKFIVSDPNDTTPEPMFEVVGGAAYIKGKKIQSGAITDTQVSSVNYNGTNMNSANITNRINYPIGSIPSGARAFIGVNVYGKKTGSNSDTYSWYVQRGVEVGGVLTWTTLPNQTPRHTWMDSDGISFAWTYVDDGLTDEMLQNQVSYRAAKSYVTGGGGGAVYLVTLTALLAKK